MDDEKEPVEEISKEELEKVFREAIEAVENMHHSLSSATEDVGYARQVLPGLFARYTVLYDEAERNPSLYPIIASGLDAIKNMGSEFTRLSGLAKNIREPLNHMTNSTGTVISSTDSALSLSGIQGPDNFASIPAPPQRKSREEYSSRLMALAESLSTAYNQIWQTYYGTSDDRYRASLFMMRQVFDHFFSHLAPDDLVRQSEYWKPKKTEKPDQIYRSERIIYTAHTHIKNSGLVGILAASAKQINSLYEAANEAHIRGSLDEENANKALLAMDSILKDWIDALT
jgi:hypothetical protein